MGKSKRIRVNVCWHHEGKNQCKTMDKEDAYKLKRWLEDNDGYTYWFQALDD